MASNSSSDYSDYDDSDNFEISDQDSFNVIPCSIPLNFALFMNPAKMSEVKINESFLATVTSRKTTQLVKVIPCQECSPESVQVPKLLQRTLDAAVGDKVAITGYDTKAKADAIQVVPLFDTEGIDYTNDLKEYFAIESHPISISATFSLLINGAIRIFRIVNIIQIDRCCTTSATRIVLIDPKDLQAPHMAVLSRHFCDLALPSEIHNHINKYIFLPLQHQRLLRSLGVRSANGVIFYGVAGTGKTSVLIAISREAHVQSLTITAPELFTMPIDQAFSKLQQGFRYVLDHTPAMLLIDDIGILAGKTDSNTPLNVRRLRSYFISLLDRSMGIPGFVVVATANSKNEIDPCLIRFGRFGFEATLELPPSPQRAEILKLNMQGINIDQDDIIKLAGKTLEGKSCANVESVAEIGVCNMIRKSIVENRTYPLDDEIIKACTGHLNLEDFPVNIIDNGTNDGFGAGGSNAVSNEPNQGGFSVMDIGNVDLNGKASDPFGAGTSFGSNGGVPKMDDSDDFFDTLSSSIPKQPGTTSGMPELDASMFLGQTAPQDVQAPKSDGGSANGADNNANGGTDMFGRPIQQPAANEVDMFGRSKSGSQPVNEEMFSGFGGPDTNNNNNSNNEQEQQQNQQNQMQQQQQQQQQQQDQPDISGPPPPQQQQQQQSGLFANFGSSDVNTNPFASGESPMQQQQQQQQPPQQAGSQPQVPQQQQNDPFANFGSTEISSNPFASDNNAAQQNNDPFGHFNSTGGFGVPQQPQAASSNPFGQPQDQQNQPFGQMPPQAGSQPSAVPPPDAFSDFRNQGSQQQQQQQPQQAGSQPINGFPGFQQQDQIKLGQQNGQEVADPFGSFGSNNGSPQQSQNPFGGSQEQMNQGPFNGPQQDQQQQPQNPFGSQQQQMNQGPFNGPQQDQQPQNPFSSQQQQPSQGPFNGPPQDQQQQPQNPFGSQQQSMSQGSFNGPQQDQQPQNPFGSQQQQMQSGQNPFNAPQQDQQQQPQNPFGSQQQPNQGSFNGPPQDQPQQNPFDSQQQQMQSGQNPFNAPQQDQQQQPQNPFGSQQQQQPSQGPFNGPPQDQPPQNPFGSQQQQPNQGQFNGPPQDQQQQDPFGSQQQPMNQNSFGGPPQQQQQQDPFGSQQQQMNQNSFGGPPQQQQDPFGSQQQQMTQNSFGGPPPQQQNQDPFGGPPQNDPFGGFGGQSNQNDPFGFGNRSGQGGFGMQQNYQPSIILGGGGIHDMFYGNDSTPPPQQNSQPVMQEPIAPLYKPNVPDEGRHTEIIDIFGEKSQAKKQQQKQQQQQQQQQMQQQPQQSGSYGGPGMGGAPAMYNNGPGGYGNNNFMNNNSMNTGGYGQNYGGNYNNQPMSTGGQFNGPMGTGGQYNSAMSTGGFAGNNQYGGGFGNNQYGGMGPGNNQFGVMGPGNNQYGGMGPGNNQFGGMGPGNNQYGNNNFGSGGFGGGMPGSNNNNQNDIFSNFDPLKKK